MLSVDVEKLYPAAKTLVKARAASRIHAKDATLYDFSPEAQACASDYMGWVDLATSPLCDMDAIQAFADEVVEAGLDTILLIGQGGSTQAPMTITKYNKHDSTRVKFRTLDSDSPSACARCSLSAIPIARWSSSPRKAAAPLSRACC